MSKTPSPPTSPIQNHKKVYIVTLPAYEYNDEYFFESDGGVDIVSGAYQTKEQAERCRKRTDVNHARNILQDADSWFPDRQDALYTQDYKEFRRVAPVLFPKTLLSEISKWTDTEVEKAIKALEERIFNNATWSDDELKAICAAFPHFQKARVQELTVYKKKV